MFNRMLEVPDCCMMDDDGAATCYMALHHFATRGLLRLLCAILLCAWNSRTDREDEQQLEHLKKVVQLLTKVYARLKTSAGGEKLDLVIEMADEALLATNLKSRFIADDSPSPASLDGHISTLLSSDIGACLKDIFDNRKITRSSKEDLALRLISQVCFFSRNELVAEYLSDE